MLKTCIQKATPGLLRILCQTTYCLKLPRWVVNEFSTKQFLKHCFEVFVTLFWGLCNPVNVKCLWNKVCQRSINEAVTDLNLVRASISSSEDATQIINPGEIGYWLGIVIVYWSLVPLSVSHTVVAIIIP